MLNIDSLQENSFTIDETLNNYQPKYKAVIEMLINSTTITDNQILHISQQSEICKSTKQSANSSLDDIIPGLRSKLPDTLYSLDKQIYEVHPVHRVQENRYDAMREK
jgi:hypothetical protein